MSSDKRRRRQNPPAQSPRVYCGILQPPQPGDASAASTAAALAEAAPLVAPLPNSDEGSLCTPGDAAATEPLDHKAPSSSSKGSSSSSKQRSPAAAMGPTAAMGPPPSRQPRASCSPAAAAPAAAAPGAAASTAVSDAGPSRHVNLGELDGGLARKGTVASAEELLQQLPGSGHDSLAACTRAPGAPPEDGGSECSGSSRRPVRRAEIRSSAGDCRVGEGQPQEGDGEVRYVDRGQQERQEQIKARMLAASGSAAAAAAAAPRGCVEASAGARGGGGGGVGATGGEAQHRPELDLVMSVQREQLAAQAAPPAIAAPLASAPGQGGLFAALHAGGKSGKALAEQRIAPPPEQAAGGSADAAGAAGENAASTAAAKQTPTKRRSTRCASAKEGSGKRDSGGKRSRRGE